MRVRGELSQILYSFHIATLSWEKSRELFVSSSFARCARRCSETDFSAKQISQPGDQVCRVVTKVICFPLTFVKCNFLPLSVLVRRHLCTEGNPGIGWEEVGRCQFLQRSHFVWHSPPQFHTTAFVLGKSWNKLFLDLGRHSSIHKSLDANALIPFIEFWIGMLSVYFGFELRVKLIWRKKRRADIYWELVALYPSLPPHSSY